MTRRIAALSACCVVPLALASCASSPKRDAVTAAASDFVTALAGGDGGGACALLTEQARASASGATNTPCAQAIVSIKPSGRTVSGVQVWGDAAQVRMGTDVLFLRLIDGRWLISAAGCKPQPKGPYDCTVES